MWRILICVLVVSLLNLSQAQGEKVVVMEDCEGKSFYAFHEKLQCDTNLLYFCVGDTPYVKTLLDCEVSDDDPIELSDFCDDNEVRFKCVDKNEIKLSTGRCALKKYDNNCDLVSEYLTNMMEWTKYRVPILPVDATYEQIVFQYKERVVVIRKIDGNLYPVIFDTRVECETTSEPDEYTYIFECEGYTTLSYKHHKIVHKDDKEKPMYEELTRNVCVEEDDGTGKITLNYQDYSLELLFDDGNCFGSNLEDVILISYLPGNEWMYSTNAYSFRAGTILLKYYLYSECDDETFRKGFVYFNKDVCSLSTNRPEYDVRYVDEKYFTIKSCVDNEEEKFEFDKCYKLPDKPGYIKVENLWVSPVIEDSSCDEYDVHCYIDSEVHLEDKFRVKYMHVTLSKESKVFLYPTPNSTIVSGKEGHIIVDNSELMMSMNQEKYDVMIDILEEEEEVSMKVIDGSYEGSFTGLLIEMDDDIEGCKSMSNDDLNYDDQSISIAFKLDESGCKFPAWGIALITVGSVMVVAAVVIIVAIVYEPFRRKILPFRRV